jgi:hypothetical protein
METTTEQQERIAAKVAKSVWPANIPVPDSKPKLKLTGRDGNAFSILGNALAVAKKAKWTDRQVSAFSALAMAGDYDHVLQTCIRYFDVR